VTRVLQIGTVDWSQGVDFLCEVEWTFMDVEDLSAALMDLLAEDAPEVYSLVLVTAPIPSDWAASLLPFMEAYCVFIDSTYLHYYQEPAFQVWFDYKQAKFVQIKDREHFVIEMTKLYFDGNYGERRNISQIQVQAPFRGRCRMEGHNAYIIDSIDEIFWTPLLYWKANIVSNPDRYLELWLEYQATADLDLRLRLYYIRQGSGYDVIKSEVLSQEDLMRPIVLDSTEATYVTCCLEVKGEGQVQVRDLHLRHSRKSFGLFIAGGQVLRDSQREELIFYFHPGNLNPPLNIYFSGYRSAEGFEGFWMMKNLNHPFILVGDPRSEGGAFYQVSQDLEELLLAKIQETLDTLGFAPDQLIFSGLSMGTTGACYYSSFFNPYALIIGKPLLAMGSMAQKQRLVRPEDFQTSLDLVNRFNSGDLQATLDALDQRVVDRMRAGTYRGTTLAVAYMKQDDYDPTAYYQLLDIMKDKTAKVISKGYLGRHNDNSQGIISWFINQYRRLLKQFSEEGGR
ncbi:MAG: accessory Sec system protein Asp2, partial [Aerococcus sanguinicola]